MNNIDKQLPTVYDPSDVEEKWYAFWMERGYFRAEVKPGKPEYCITIPPPNVTGSLHIGHALCYTIQDVLIRWKRMQGFETLCLPGTDHAGIGTQNKVEQKLAEEGLTRHDLGREEFLKRVWEWKHKYGGEILHQFKTMGFSFDWDRERFTMDDGYVDAVLESFIRLFDKGYIYRGARVVNWCPRCHTAISDIEVEYVEQHSHLWHFRYPLEDGSGYLVVATTRPETMLGDTAVAVNPDDERYTDAVGKTVVLPLVGRRIPVVADAYVDKEFGTGAVKVTPAHDPNDFEIGMRHDLPQVVVIGIDGSMTQEAGTAYEGLDRFEARERVVADLTARGLIEKIEEYSHSVGTCARCHTVIEPLLSEQWFCKMQELARPAADAVRDHRIRFVPDRYERIYIEWMENVRDWCISRQLWWGHRIPIYKCDECGEVAAAKSEDEAIAKLKCGHPSTGSGCTVTQDPDVLDTWFSSALWPFATLGWPKKTPELDYFYPTDVLVTARDIIYLWVARMIFSSLEYLDEIPYKEVYIYATVMNEEGKRMSKSLGTGVDPLDLIERFGADSLRFALMLQAGMNQDIRFSDKRVADTRNFTNKIWNASRFGIMNLADYEPTASVPSGDALEDRWIRSRLQKTIGTVNESLGSYSINEAAGALYEFIWSEFCDWYIELVKLRLRAEGAEKTAAQANLYSVLYNVALLLHPIMPFITEEIWQALPRTESKKDSIMVAGFPVVDESAIDEEAEREMAFLMEAIRAVRNLRAEVDLPPSKRIAVVSVATDEVRRLIERNAESVKALARVSELSFVDSIAEADKSKYMAAHLPGLDLHVEIAGLVDVEAEIGRIETELQSLEKELAPHVAKLSSEQFTSKAPAPIVEKERRIVSELTEKKQKLMDRRRSIAPEA